MNALVETAPATPYKFRALILPALHDSTYNWAGICFRESATGKIVTVGPIFETIGGGAAGFISYQKWNSATSHFGAYQDRKSQAHSGPIWCEIEADGTNLKYRWGLDGYNWMDEHSTTKADFFTTAPDQIGGFVCAEAGTVGAGVTFVSWDKY